MTKEYFSPKEVAEKLSVNRKTILSLINTGRIHAIDIAVGTRALYRIPIQELENFINKNKEYGQEKNTKDSKID